MLEAMFAINTHVLNLDTLEIFPILKGILNILKGDLRQPSNFALIHLNTEESFRDSLGTCIAITTTDKMNTHTNKEKISKD
jgi:hypothetical protein